MVLGPLLKEIKGLKERQMLNGIKSVMHSGQGPIQVNLKLWKGFKDKLKK